ncbi:MAG: gamma-glutamylcyclotransferase [Pseudomonadota bacterium]
MDRLFVYGTLAPGRANSHILADVSGDWIPAGVRGHLKPEGWGADLGYPAMIPDASAPLIEGFIFESDQLHEHWARLDEFEGDAYCRVQDTARLSTGASVSAYVYALATPENR